MPHLPICIVAILSMLRQYPAGSFSFFFLSHQSLPFEMIERAVKLLTVAIKISPILLEPVPFLCGNVVQPLAHIGGRRQEQVRRSQQPFRLKLQRRKH